jgi:hypothetical protein
MDELRNRKLILLTILRMLRDGYLLANPIAF